MNFANFSNFVFATNSVPPDDISLVGGYEFDRVEQIVIRKEF